MDLITYYTILGVSESASFKEIQKAYREKALAYHPDINKSSDAEQIFIRIQKAYKVLSDPDRRFKYDNDLNNYREELYKKIKNTPNKSKVKSYDNIDKKNKIKLPKPPLTWKSFCGRIFVFITVILLGIVFINDILKQIECKNESNSPKEENIDFRLKLEQQGCVKRTYDILNSHYDMGTIEEYVKLIQEPKQLQKVYDTLTIKYYLIDDFETFSSKMQASIKEFNYYKLNQLKTGDTPYKKYYKNIVNQNLNNYILIKNTPHSDVIVLLKNIQTNKVVRNVYIKSGIDYKIKNIPEGIYSLKCMYGNNWNPQKQIGQIKGCFDSDLSFSETSEKDYFDMNVQENIDGINIPSYTVTLYKVRNGNMSTKTISANQFFE